MIDIYQYDQKKLVLILISLVFINFGFKVIYMYHKIMTFFREVIF